MQIWLLSGGHIFAEYEPAGGGGDCISECIHRACRLFVLANQRPFNSFNELASTECQCHHDILYRLLVHVQPNSIEFFHVSRPAGCENTVSEVWTWAQTRWQPCKSLTLQTHLANADNRVLLYVAVLYCMIIKDDRIHCRICIKSQIFSYSPMLFFKYIVR